MLYYVCVRTRTHTYTHLNELNCFNLLPNEFVSFVVHISQPFLHFPFDTKISHNKPSIIVVNLKTTYLFIETIRFCYNHKKSLPLLENDFDVTIS